MQGLDLKNFEKSVKKIIDRWQGKVAGLFKDIAKINKQLEVLDAKKELTPEETKLRERCAKARKVLQKKVDKAALEMRVELAIITPPPEAAKSELEKAFTKIKRMVKDIEKKLQLPGGVKITPDVEFDFKKKKFKKIGVTIRWGFR